jgi:glycerol-3-phosphate dehydrogenase subunit B
LNAIDCELAVVGAGMAGMAAALFAARRGVDVVQIGRPLGFTYASGLFDLMAVHPVETGKTWPDPWACIEALVREIPQHPYSKLSRKDMQTALDEVVAVLKAAGIRYRGKDGVNVELVTAAGTVKQTFRVPQTMWAGAAALENRDPCLLVDFQGLREFSARQIAAVCRDRWPNLRAMQLAFPGIAAGREIITGDISARTIAQPDNLAQLVRAIRPHIGAAKAVGFPAILGVTEADRVVADLENQLGTAVPAPVRRATALGASCSGGNSRRSRRLSAAARQRRSRPAGNRAGNYPGNRPVSVRRPAGRHSWNTRAPA